ncbi:MAG: lysylphosphatidylglycerol synthase transmembrane domain-containing protein [Candidatus Dojkabacteria bacterium]|jgi:uncharacterized protein (TIRG00374 family)|nr:lysylphosphatidylglycerol synthase transmembrane domain-containing protein [Candidatus Dojkabacteria bacterium]
MKSLKKYISPILTIFVLTLFAIYLFKNPEIIDRLVDTQPMYILLIMLLYLSIFFLEGLFIIVTLRIFSKDMNRSEGMYVATLSRIGNYLLPMRAGAVFRATYLKKKFNFDYSNFLATLYGYYIVFFLTNAILAFIVLVFKSFIFDQTYISLILFFLAVIVGMVVLIFLRFPFKKIFKQKSGIIFKVISFLEKFLGGWDLIVRNRKLFIQLMLLAFANVFVNILVIYLQFISIEKVGNILDIILYTCISGVSLLISITPGSLGLREAILLITSKSLGLSQIEVMQLAFLDRGIMFVLLLICLIVISIFFKRFNLKEVFFEKRESL